MKFFLPLQKFILAWRILQKEKPAAIIVDLGNDSEVRLHNCFVRLGALKKIPTLLYTYVLFLPSNDIVYRMGRVKHILVSSQFQKDIMVKQGIVAERVLVTGQANDDALFEIYQNLKQHKSDLCRQLAVPFSTKIILYAVPQYGEHKDLNWQEHWQLLEESLSVMTAPKNVKVLLSLHPRVIRESYQYLEKKFPVKILEKSCSEMMPLADLFVATVSALLRVALLCRVPILLYNPLAFSHLYQKTQGLTEVRRPKDFQGVFNKLIADENFFRSKRQEMGLNQDYFGFLDGKNTERALAFIDDITASSI